jgi:hypothetical protein
MSYPIKVWIVMNESGEYVVASDEETASDRAEEELNEDEPRRYVILKFRLGPPDDNVSAIQTIELTID